MFKLVRESFSNQPILITYKSPGEKEEVVLNLGYNSLVNPIFAELVVSVLNNELLSKKKLYEAMLKYKENRNQLTDAWQKMGVEKNED